MRIGDEVVAAAGPGASVIPASRERSVSSASAAIMPSPTFAGDDVVVSGARLMTPGEYFQR
jgi:hypothetical protein